MKYKQYNLNGRVFNYMLAFERYGYEIELGGGQCRITMSEKELIALGAVPCEKCGEREGFYSAPTYSAPTYSIPLKHEPSVTEPKEEKIDMPIFGINMEGKTVLIPEYIETWIQAVTNKLNKD